MCKAALYMLSALFYMWEVIGNMIGVQNPKAILVIQWLLCLCFSGGTVHTTGFDVFRKLLQFMQFFMLVLKAISLLSVT